jgi:hypothetical protein
VAQLSAQRPQPPAAAARRAAGRRRRLERLVGFLSRRVVFAEAAREEAEKRSGCAPRPAALNP